MEGHVSTVEERMINAIEELEQENRLLRARNTRLEAELMQMQGRELKSQIACEQALAVPVQEPVAWRYDLAKYRENDLRERQWAHSVFSPTKPYIDEMVRNLTPLYTTPPAARRQWVGLTDEQKLSLEIQGGKSDVMLAELVESWLKEKNT